MLFKIFRKNFVKITMLKMTVSQLSKFFSDFIYIKTVSIFNIYKNVVYNESNIKAGVDAEWNQNIYLNMYSTLY